MRRIAGPLWSPGAPHGQAYYGTCWEATVIEMEIDPITFQPRVRGVWTTLEGGGDWRDEAAQALVEGSVLYSLDYLLFDKGRYAGGIWQESVPGEHPALGVLDIPEVSLNVLDRGKSGFGDLAVVGVAPAGAAAMEQATGVPVAAAPFTALRLAAGAAQ
jgi:CO/xanthine dehydrogenase Mo-binding subunit